jgi:lysozyme
VTDELLADLRRDEGWRDHVYKDSLGFDTIGYGFLVDERKGVGLPKPVAEFWLRYAVNERLAEFRKLWPHFDAQPQDVQRALGNMVYQLGPAGVLAFKKMLAALEVGDRIAAVEAALDSKWATQTPARAQRVAALIRGKA